MNPRDEDGLAAAPNPVLQSEPAQSAQVIPGNVPKPAKNIVKKYILGGLFVLFTCLGFAAHRLAIYGSGSGYKVYNGAAPLSFEYPKNWILEEEDTLQNPTGSYKITISTPDYASKQSNDRRSNITTQGYRLSVLYTKSDGVLTSTDAMYDYLADEGSMGLKKLQTPQGIVMVQSVGQSSAILGDSHNASTTSFYTKNGFDYWLTYNYPDKNDFVPDPTYSEQYDYMLSSFKEKP